MKTFTRLPTELSLGFSSIDRVTKIVTGPVANKLNEIGMRPTVRTRSTFVKKRTNRSREIYVADFVVSANVVILARLAIRANGEKRLDMVIYVKPITNVPTIAINRNRSVRQGLANDRRNQLLAVLKWAIIVRAIGNNGRQTER